MLRMMRSMLHSNVRYCGVKFGISIVIFLSVCWNFDAIPAVHEHEERADYIFRIQRKHTNDLIQALFECFD